LSSVDANFPSAASFGRPWHAFGAAPYSFSRDAIDRPFRLNASRHPLDWDPQHGGSFANSVAILKG
jgi:hypothetical protein